MLEKLNELATGAKAGVMLAIAAVIIAAGYYGPMPGVSAMADKNKADQDALTAKKAENQKLEQFVGKLNEMDAQIASLKAQMERQKEIVPDEKQADKFITLLQDTAAGSGINLRKISADPAVKKEYYSEVPYKIEIDGPYYGVLTFFDKLATQTRIVNVDNLAMKSLSKNSGGQYNYGPTDSVAVTANAKTFFSNEANANAPAPAAPAKK
jgi:type IV pilus assembly protein PilO